MQTPRFTRNRLLSAAASILLFLPAAVPAHAVSKEMVQLQTQVQQLLDMVQRLQSTLDSRFGVMQDLAQQTADQAKQMAQTVNALQQKLNTEVDAINGKQDTLSGQAQSLNDSLDELKARIAKLDKSVQDLQSQLQAMQAQQTQAAQGGVPPGGAQPGTMPPGGTANPAGSDQAPGIPNNPPGANAPAPNPALQAPPLQETFQAAERDFDAGKIKVAQGEFESIVHYYPLDDLAGTAEFYLGEIAYQQKDYTTAINEYNAVLEGFSGNAKAPAAQLHKAYCLMATDKRQAGIDELRELIRRHPQTPEARAARSKLNGMGVRIEPGQH
jgi:TolA-binding protein